ncbi:dihydrofolate reductase family protein [Nocardia puris]|uniref:Dihydrofolate reductase n=1 Tax=Nocardia puris TaxID=208602 RepID=A0A366DA44_9NOCA|nr:dihydrofolate reductase family protein [Nocardia puris]RBO86927.1 dihydrofolate reductase [Nocardia puris]
MTTVYYTAASLDGFLIGEDGSLDWLAGVESIEEDDGFFDGIGAMCMGANTYEWIRANEPPESWHEMHGDLPCWVFTHRDLPAIPGANLRFVSGDVAPVHREMRAAAGDRTVWIGGGGDLAGQFADAGSLDEVIVGVAPVTLGAGAPLLPRRLLSDRLRLVDVEKAGQFARLTYRLG